MKKKHAYRATAIENVRLAELLPALVTGCIVALDVAKEKFLVSIATWAGATIKLFRFEHPKETRAFLELMKTLQNQLGSTKLKAAMEPTGTYGDAIRFQLAQCGVSVAMVQPKKTSDSREIFDGVPSLHDGKSAVLIARLCGEGVGAGTKWEAPNERRARLRALVEERGHEYRREELCLGRIEALTARHWPEYGLFLSPRQASGIALLEEFPSPARVSANAEGARQALLKASRGMLKPEKIEGTVQGAAGTLGLPAVAEEEHFMQTLASEAVSARRAQDALEEKMRQAVEGDEVLTRLQDWMGVYTGTTIVALCDPMQYEHVDEFVKACGLNLREKSSGKYKGQMKLTKRGPSLVRQVLYMFTLRMIESSAETRAWYEAHIKGEKLKMKAVIATTRKLACATFYVARGRTFDPSKLFDLKRLEVAAKLPGRQKPPPKDVPKKSAPIAAVSHTAADDPDLPWKKYLPKSEVPLTA